MIAMAEPKLEKSTVVNVQDGKSIPSSVRTPFSHPIVGLVAHIGQPTQRGPS